MLTVKNDRIPKKILDHINSGIFNNFLGTFKTDIKPNATIPLLWMVFFEEGIIFCNTHKTRGLTDIIPVNEIDSIRLTKHTTNEHTMCLIFKDLTRDDLIIKISSEINIKVLHNILTRLGVQIL